MANSIEIEIVANFKDNATDQVKELNAELDKLEKRNIDITAKIDSMNANIDRWTSQSIIGSKPEQAVEKVKEFSEKILSGTTKMTIDVDDNATPKLKGVQRTMDELEKAEKRVQFRPHSSGNYTPMYDYHPTPVDSSRKFHGSLSASAEKVKTGELESSAERIADELNDINHSSKSYVPKGGYTYDDDAVRAIEITPLEEEADRRLLEQDARTMGIKFSSKTSNDELSQKIADYEDKNYWSKQGSQSNREIVSAGEEQGEEITDGYLNSLGQGMKNVTSKVASRFMGARMLYKGINDAASDFSSAFEAEYGIDRNRSLARGATKGGLMAAGALIGTAIPGVGTVLGAGAGALISTLFGDDLADMFSGIHKSAEELAQDHLDELFGDIAMSADDMMVVVKGLTTNTKALQMGYNQQSVQTEYALAQSSTDSYYDLKEQGSRMEILNNLGLKTDKSERATYKQSVEDYTDGLKKQLLQEMYDSFAVNDDLYGYGNWDASALSKKYEDTYGDLEKNTKDLFKYLDRAFSDNDFTTDEIEHVATVLGGLKELSSNAGPDEFAVNNEKYNWLISNGMLSKDSYDAFQGDIWTNTDKQIENIANTRARAVLERPESRADADKNAGEQIVSTYESSAQTWLNGFEKLFGNDYTTALEQAYNTKYDNWNGGYTGLGIINDPNSYEMDALRYAYGSDPNDNAGLFTEGIRDFGNRLSKGWDHVDDGQRSAFRGEYEKISPEIAKMEQSLAAASKIEGVDISAPMDELMKMYSIGAMGGGDQGKIAANKFNAMYMAGNKEVSEMINSAYGNDYELMNRVLGEGFGDAWKLIFDQNKENANQAENQMNEAGEKIKDAGENAAKQASEAAGDTASAATETVEDNTNTAAEAIKDKTEDMFNDITDATQQSGEQANEAAKSAAEGLGESILNAIGESLDNIDADMLGESGIGEKLMNSITESLSADNMDFGELSIGQSILEGISSSFEGVEFGEIDIGTKIMDAISASLEGVDFSGITEGITSQLQELGELQCDIELNAQDNITDMATAADTAVREIPETWETTLSAVDNASAIANSVAEAVNAIPTSVNVSITATTSGFPAGFHFASGTPNAPEGMAWLNDDGTADPRELIEHNGQFMMYEGRDVLAPLSKGDRVFTSAQTKDILSGKGIPHFAEGVNNEVIATNRETIGSGSSGASVSIDGVNINITIEGNSNGNVVEEIRQRSGEIAEIVTAEIQRHLSASIANSSGGDD